MAEKKRYQIQTSCPQCGCSGAVALSKEELIERYGDVPNIHMECGECMLVCPVEALTRDSRGIVRLNSKICVGCLSCVGFCPTASMFVAPEEPIPFKCVACGACVKTCPTGALSIQDLQEPLDKVFYRRHF